jgi:hypothetical protein
MDIDLSTPNAEWITLPAITTPVRNRPRRLAPLLIAHRIGPICVSDRASITFGLVPETHQTYPAEDDCTTSP